MSFTFTYGREPGFPKTQQTADLTTGKVVTTTEDEYKLVTSVTVDVSEDVLNALPIQLAYGSRLGSAGLRTRGIERDPKNRLQWHLKLHYSSEIDEATSADQTKPPELRRAKYTWDFETRDILFSKDVDNGDPVVNAVGEPFELTTEFVIPILNIGRAQTVLSPNTIKNYVNHTNKDPFWGFPARTVCLAGIRDRENDDTWNGIRIRWVDYVLKMIVPNIPNVIEGWKEIIMNRGSFYKEGGVNKVFTVNGSRVIGKLTAAGGKLPDADPPVFLKFNRLKGADFGDLGIDLNQLIL